VRVARCGMVWPGLETDSRPHGRCAPERAPFAQWATTHLAFSWKKAGRDPEVSLLTDKRGLHQHHRSGWYWRHEACSLRKRVSGGFGSRFGQPGNSAIRDGSPGGVPPLLQWATRRHYDQVCVFDAPEGAPHRIAPMALPDIRPETDGSPTPLSPGRDPVSRPWWGACLRGGRVQPLLPKRQARRGRVARERARLRPPGPDEQVAETRARRVRRGTQRTETLR